VDPLFLARTSGDAAGCHARSARAKSNAMARSIAMARVSLAVVALLTARCGARGSPHDHRAREEARARLVATAVSTCAVGEGGEPRCWGLVGHSVDGAALGQLPRSPRQWAALQERVLPNAQVVAGFRGRRAEAAVRRREGACFALGVGPWGCVESVRGFSLDEGELRDSLAHRWVQWPSWQSCESNAGWLECLAYDESVRRAPLSSRVAALLDNGRSRCVWFDGDLHCDSSGSRPGERATRVDQAAAYAHALTVAPVATEIAHASMDGGGVSWLDARGAWWMRRDGEERSAFAVGESAAPFVALASSLDETCARSRDASVWCVRREQRAARRMLGDSLEIAAGARHFCARQRGDVVQCWGDPALGRLGRQTANGWSAERVALDEPVRAASAGWGHSCAVLRSGRVVCWGLRDVETTEDAEAGLSIGARYRAVFVPTEIGAVRGAVAIASGGAVTCATTADERLCWSGADGGALRRVTEGERDALTRSWYSRDPWRDRELAVIDVCAGVDYRCLLLRTGEVQCTIPGCARVVHSATTTCGGPLGLVPVAGLPPHMTGLTCGGAHACAWNANGELFCWGSDVYAQRATRVDRDSAVPRPVDVRFDQRPREE
jgi:hypothetical protein